MTTTIAVTTKRQGVLPKARCERKSIRPGTSPRITEVGDGFYVTPVPEPTEAELAAVLKTIDESTARQIHHRHRGNSDPNGNQKIPVRAAEKKSVTVAVDTNVVVSAAFWPNSLRLETLFKGWCFLGRVINVLL